MTALHYMPQSQWQPGPPAAVFGELSADGTDIILIAQGDDWQLDQIAARLHRMTANVKPVLEHGRDTDAMTVPATWASVVQLGYSFNGFPGFAWLPQPRLNEWIIAETIRRTAPVPPLPENLIPPWVKRKPRPYQLDGAAKIAAGGRFLLLDEPGLGKAGTTLLGLEARRLAGHQIFPVIIVVPSWEVGQAWADEITAWELDWPAPVMYRGTGRLALLRDAGTKILITTYATLRRDAPDVRAPLVRWGAPAVVADEFHLASNNESLQSLALRRIAKRAGTFVALSGTWITRDTGDAQPVLEAGWPRDWPSKKRMTERYCAKIAGEYDERIVGLNPEAAPEFFAIMDANMRRVAKADVLPQLPPKIYSVRKPEIPPEWAAAYRGMAEDMLAALPDGSELPVMTVLIQMMRLSQLASSAADVEKIMEWDESIGDYVPKYNVTLRAPSWKAESLLGVMAERPGAPVVCFTASRQLAMITGKYCTDAGYRTGYLVGVGGGITSGTRRTAISDFQAGKLDVIVATARAGGTGITLTRAGTVVFLQRDWALDHGTQPEDRCLATGTPVLTPDGWRPVEGIAPGDLVVTHTGTAEPVIDAWSRNTQSGSLMAEISVTGQQPVTCTADHLFMLRDGTWKAAEDLRPGDWLAMPGNDVTGELACLPFEGERIADTFTSAGIGQGAPQRNGRLRHAPDIIQVTDDFLYVLGYFAGDGFASTGDDKGRFISFSGNTGSKTAALDRCERWASSLGLHGKRRQHPGDRGAEQRFYSAEWAYWFKHHFTNGQTGARNKHLPGFALKLNERQSRVVLDGLSASDGYRRDGGTRCEYSTMSPQLAANVLQLATRAGHRPSLTGGSTGQHIIAFGGKPGPHNAGRVRSVLLRYATWRGGVHEQVHDITVKNAETFVAGGIVVHNCQRADELCMTHDRIEIIDVVAKGTVEDRVRTRLREKAGMLGEIVRDPRLVKTLLGGLR